MLVFIYFLMEQFGLTQEDRECNLKKARQIAQLANITAVVLTVGILFAPRLYEWGLLLLLVMPWAGIGIIGYFKGVVRFSIKKSSPYPSVNYVVYIPTLGILARNLGYDLYVYNVIWLLAILLGGILTTACLAVCRKVLAEQNGRVAQCVFILIFACAYSFGAIVVTNCYYDRSVPQEFRVEVKDKSISSGRATTYYLRLDPWGRFTEEEDVSVSKRLYKKTQTGDQVHVYLQKGKWNIPWYWVTD
jgi:hypothetical protein